MSWARGRALFALLMVLCSLLAAPARAALVPASYRAAILLRSLGYERTILAGKGELTLLVLHTKEPSSQADAREMAASFGALAARINLANRKVQIRSLLHTSLTDTGKALASLKPAAVYFAIGTEALSSQLASQADLAHWVPMCADGARLDAGCALGVRPLDEASQLVVDLRRAKRAGLSFDARLLRLAQVLQ